MADEDVIIRLTRAESLVLFEWLSRPESGKGSSFRDPAEEKVLWTIEGQLESTLQEPFAPNYEELVAAARRIVADG